MAVRACGHRIPEGLRSQAGVLTSFSLLGAAEGFESGMTVISVDNGGLMHRKLAQWFHRGDGDPKQDSVWEADGEMSVKGGRGVKHPCSGLNPFLSPRGMILECPQRVLEALRRGTYKMRWVIGHIPGWR